MTAWLPTDLGAKLADWWSVADSGTVTQSGGVISQITNKGNNAWPLTPGYDTGAAYSITALNGYPGFTTNGSSTALQTWTTGGDYYWAHPLTQPWGLHFIGQVLGLPGSGDKGLVGGEPGWNGCPLELDASGAIYFYAAGAANYTLSTGVVANDFTLLSLTANGTSSAASFNGVAVGGSPDPGPQYQSGFVFGRNQFSSSYTNAVFGEIVTTTGTLTSGEQEKLEGYLAWSCGKASLLPSGHPYKSAAPTTGGGGATLNPGAGAVAFTGQAPALSAAQNLSPAAGSLAFAGRAPALAATGALSPTAGAVAFTGYAPGLGLAATFGPGSGTVTFTGQAPALTGAGNLPPGAGAFAITGRTPALTQAAAPAPGAGSLVFTGRTPALTAAGALPPAAGGVTFTGRTPGLTEVASLSPGAGALALIGYAPALSGSVATHLMLGAGTLIFTGHEPALAAAFLTWTPVSGVSETWSAVAVTSESWAPASPTAKIWSLA